ncbi:MAG: J domain-containing protein [Gammaproteobacteria bacterium]
MDIAQCYATFDLEPGCSWAVLHASYRRQVQKWHPDRHQLEPAQQALAAQRMLAINEAFGMLARHYRQHGVLPGQPAQEDAAPSQPAVDPEKNAPTTLAQSASAQPDAWDFDLPRRQRVFSTPHRRHTLSAAPWLLLFALLGLGYVLLARYAADNGADRAGTAAPPYHTSTVKPVNKFVFSYGDPPEPGLRRPGLAQPHQR